MTFYGPLPAICRVKDCDKPIYPRPYSFRIGEFWTDWWFCEEHYEECCEQNLDRDMAYLEEQSEAYSQYDDYNDSESYFSGGW